LLSRGLSISVDSSNREFLVSLSCEIENRELGFRVMNVNASEYGREITRENVFARLFDLRRFDCDSDSDFNFGFSREIAFVASHFHEMSNSELSSLSLPILSEILSLKELKIASEDQLHSIIWEFISRDCSHFSLLGSFLSNFCLFHRFADLSNLPQISSICLIHRFGRV
jgi:hypothetical protein